MFDDRIFHPYTKDGVKFEQIIALVKNSVELDDRILSEVIRDAVYMISQGEKFTLPCPCGCGNTEIHIPIAHYMIDKACELKNKTEKAFMDVLKDNEKQRLEAEINPEYGKKVKGSWATRGIKLKKLLRLE